MSEGIITRHGGGGVKEPFAVINVTYPIGSICTCTDGVKTFTAKDTSGKWIFIIPYAATWTVTATDGSSTATKAVEITTDRQSEAMELSYRYYIFLEGQGAVVPMSCQYSVNGGGSIASDKISTWYSGGGAGGNTGVFATDKINLSNYNAIVFESTCSQYYATTDPKWRRTVGAFASADYYGNSSSAVAHKFVPNSSARQFYSVDISSITGEYYIGTNGIGGGAIYNLWLE